MGNAAGALAARLGLALKRKPSSNRITKKLAPHHQKDAAQAQIALAKATAKTMPAPVIRV
jgi:hypothetical protein